MVLIVLEKELQKIQKDLDKLDFPDLVRSCRESIGLMQHKAAEFLGITPARLKFLEQGLFKKVPGHFEICCFSMLYDIKISILEEKARNYVRRKKSLLHKMRKINA